MGAVRLFLFTIAALPSVLSAQVRVQCRAENGAAVPFATVTWWPHGEAITAQTDDRGALTLPADPGRPLVLTVRMMGFSDLEDTLRPRRRAALPGRPHRRAGPPGHPLAAMPDDTQERLINWGYAICDAAVRRWVDHTLPPPAGFPYPRGV